MGNAFMKLGCRLGCHQRPERSFYFKGKQFPVCARCTGVFVGQILTIALYSIVKPNNIICILFCAILLVDWLIQYFNIIESTNIRRFITGIFCGYGMLNLEINAVIWICNIILRRIGN